MARRSQSLPPETGEHQEALDRHHVRHDTGQVPKRVLPRTDVPQYLEETPMQEQDRHDKSFHTNQPAQNQGFHKDAFSRPGLEDNIKLIEENLADAQYFEMRWRRDDTAEPKVALGDGSDPNYENN